MLKALSDSYPSDRAIAETGSLPLVSLSPASNIRHRVRYSIGEVPTVSLNFSANVDRDIPAHSAKSCSVHPCAGSSCIAVIAARICSSASAKSHPTPPRNPSAKCSRKACTSIICASCCATRKLPGRGSRSSSIIRSSDHRIAALSDSLRMCTIGGSTPSRMLA